MKFKVVARGLVNSAVESDSVILELDNWNDYSFVTFFQLYYCNSAKEKTRIGAVKIGFKGQTTSESTHSVLDRDFMALSSEFFSLGQDVEFYRNLRMIPDGVGENILKSLRDVVLHPEIISEIKGEEVFRVSLLREISLSIIKGQFLRVLRGAVERTDFNFNFRRMAGKNHGGLSLGFAVQVDSTPTTNIHALIGRNGVGKTTLLNEMIEAIVNKSTESKFFSSRPFSEEEMEIDYFSGLVSVSFSAFDSFKPPLEQPDPAKGACYFYIGLKDEGSLEKNRTISALRSDCAKSLIGCFRNERKKMRWLDAIEKLGSDENFAAMKLEQLYDSYRDLINDPNQDQPDSQGFLDEYLASIDRFLSRMSSGHSVVLLTVTRLVENVQEKTLVLLDEPESHLHPPLLSAFIRALSDLLNDQNGVAIIATHSPVVLQEIPKSCVWKMHRVGKEVSASRPNIETFAENVGRLTSEVFRLEVSRSGFHALLEESVKDGSTFDEIIKQYRGQLGFEGRAILAALIANRDGVEA